MNSGCFLVSNSGMGESDGVGHAQQSRARWLVSLAVIIGILLTCVWCVLYVTDLRARHRAEALIRDISSFRLGVTTIAAVLPLLGRYDLWPHPFGEACKYIDPASAPETSYLLHAGSVVVNTVDLKLPLVRKTGINPLGAVADLHFKSGKLCALDFRIGTTLETNGESLKADVREVWSDSQIPFIDHPGYGELFGSSQPWLRHRVEIWLSSNATVGDYKNAFDFDLSCLQSLHGCLDACELMPSVWRDYQGKAHDNGWTVSPEEKAARCTKL
jgi:hypothetical protein